MAIREEYEKLRKQYKLPTFDKLDFEFEIRGIEDNAFILREVRKHIMDRLEQYANYISELLQPEPTVANLRESQDFTSKEKTEMYDLYKRLMIAHRAGMEVAIDGEERANAAYIIEICKDWDKLKKQMRTILQKVKGMWLKDTEVHRDVGYFG